MDRQAYKDEIVFRLTGGVLDLELDDSALDRVLDASLREIQRYINTSKFVTLPFDRCIDLSKYNVNSVVAVYRAKGYVREGVDSNNGLSHVDPMYASQWQFMAGMGNVFDMSGYLYNYAAWNTLLQIRNTASTDLAFIYDNNEKKLYINVSSGQPENITVEFIPRYMDVSEIESDYWIDMTMRLAVALSKVTLGRIRSRYTQNGALWSQDGDRLLEEGNSELAELREKLYTNSDLFYVTD